MSPGLSALTNRDFNISSVIYDQLLSLLNLNSYRYVIIGCFIPIMMTDEMSEEELAVARMIHEKRTKELQDFENLSESKI